ncbi:MAG: hypothetical protein EBW86_08965 [Rhodobacteraceae bacterium]|nr:hypothetical protein [Paracoccaceae bacterium]
MIADICIIGDGYSSTVLLLNLARKKFDLKKVEQNAIKEMSLMIFLIGQKKISLIMKPKLKLVSFIGEETFQNI